MATGYTSMIVDGDEPVSLRAFMLRAVRAMGVLITMRDDPMSAPIPQEIEPSDYHFKAWKGAKAHLEVLRQMTDEGKELQAQDAYERSMKSWAESRDLRLQKKIRYTDMLNQVLAWKPPTPEHEGFKEFMVKQIQESIEWDCGTSYYRDPPQRETGEDWYAAEIASAERDIKHHAKKWSEELERVRERTEWIAAFWESLPPEDPEAEKGAA